MAQWYMTTAPAQHLLLSLQKHADMNGEPMTKKTACPSTVPPWGCWGLLLTGGLHQALQDWKYCDNITSAEQESSSQHGIADAVAMHDFVAV